ncbi:glycoside hydrolase family 3 protein [Microbacterium atlanticum]|uniref:glycoside hydrolase family 3 protein n=1 Tax=Microbacterium atlanticum TaxID=2782168 RepID=UPI0018883304|nr:glycoside hydrolase family 3 C-terminal domain-containing protein [Microbacterium atlanticum]
MSSSPPRRARLTTVAALAVASLLVGLTAAPASAANDEVPWMDPSLSADDRTDLLLAELSLDEKITMLIQSGGAGLPERLIPAIRGKDGCCGLSATDIDTTALPAGVALASTWDPELAEAYGDVSGDEAWRAGYTSIAGPTMDLVRSPYNGRQWESFGEDPLLNGAIATGQVVGQESNPVHSIVKHYNLNNQETRRGHVNVVVDERTLREVYTRPWEPVIAADPGAVMCAFNKVNGEYSCGNGTLQNDILKNDLGFKGYISSDFNATHSFADYENGLDVAGPGIEFSASNLKQAVLDGTVSEERVDDATRRVLYALFSQGTIDNPPANWDVFPQPASDALPADVLAEHDAVAEKVATEGIVLLQNDKSALPLNAGKKVGSIAVIGADADHYIDGGGSGAVQNPADLTTILDGIEAAAGDAQVTYTAGGDPVSLGDTLTGLAPVPSDVLTPSGGELGDGLNVSYTATTMGMTLDRVDSQVNLRTGISGTMINTSQVENVPALFAVGPITARWTGSITAPTTGEYTFGLSQIGQASLTIGDTQVISPATGDNDVYGTDQAKLSLKAGQSYPVVVEYATDAPNQFDGGLNDQAGAMVRLGWTPPKGTTTASQQAAVDAAAAADVAVVVVRDYTGEAADRGDLTLPQNQDALVSAVAKANKRTIVVLATSGAVLMPWLNDVEGVVQAWYGGQAQGDAVASVLFGETNPSGKLPITFPASEAQVADTGITNEFDTLAVVEPEVRYDEGLNVGYKAYLANDAAPLFSFGHGLSYTSFKYDKKVTLGTTTVDGETRTTATVTVRNQGKLTGTEKVQVYVGSLPGVSSPEKQLAGWASVTLDSKQSAEVTVVLDEHAFQYWNTEADAWTTATGSVTLEIGSSSSDIRATTKTVIPAG